ncbi:sporulation membrane protein YtaF [Clostridium sp. MSJ-4]|uniref:Sporulation membrane protein YtaF n=1 Tax=Clostridium simiarum TaxID=2841506 RepID=A0ABS6F1P1_9CLOT|nr:sporulation membrane protein YtaF [Clostridium simiarum]MBU5591457.1 sporulation membrane protein YtaF [Clostridium simiarum]
MLESILLVLAVSLDAFVASIAYGTNKIKVPFISVTIINIICSSFLGLSLLFGSIVKKFIPGNITSIISFSILLLLGIYYLFQGLVKNYIGKNSSKRVDLKLFNFRFIIDIYADETKADINNSKTLDPKEAFYLAVALSLDSLAVGFGSSLGDINYFQVIVLSLICGIFSIWTGTFLGRKFAEKSKIDLSWLGGIMLIILSVLKVI